MPEKTPRKERSDKGTRRNDKPEDERFAFRLNETKPAEALVLNAIRAHLTSFPNDTIKTIVMTCITERLPHPLNREEKTAETLDQQIERLASAIDRLLSLNLQRVSQGANLSSDEGVGGVDMGYMKRLQETLRGAKK